MGALGSFFGFGGSAEGGFTDTGAADDGAGDELGSPGKLNALICGWSGMSPSTLPKSAARHGEPPPFEITASMPSFTSEATLRKMPRNLLGCS